jgi:putative Holliday junction resolvase
MGRILAIDYGKKRSGVAITDENNIIASGLATVDTNKLTAFLKQVITEKGVEVIVLGDPKGLDNQNSEWSENTNKFENVLRAHFPKLKIERVDERFTSKMAFQTMIDGGLKKKARRNKALVDEISATIILQSYMSAKGI